MEERDEEKQYLLNGVQIGQVFADAEAGVASAQFDLAHAYENGGVLAVDVPEAIRWYKTAAEHLHPGAHYRLGALLHRSISLQDSKTAVEYFQKGAELGDVECQCALADAYRDGQGVNKDETLALHWYKKASDQGNTYAHYRLGKIYRYGTTGVPRDITLAIQYFAKAAQQGHTGAATALEKAKTYAQSAPPTKSIKADQEPRKSEAQQPSRSIPFVMIDTSVLLKDPDVIRRVVGNKGIPCICYAVLSELDYNKNNTKSVAPDSGSTVGRNAKLLLRELAKANPTTLQELPEEGKPINGDLIQEFTFRGNSVLVFTRKSQRGNHDNDAKIISIAHDYGMIIITADSGLQVRARAQGVEGILWTGPERSENNSGTSQPRSPTRPPIVPFELHKEPTTEKPVNLSISAVPKEGEYVYSGENGKIRLVKSLSAGGEGTIFETDQPDRVCKIYHKDRLTTIRQKKIELMLSRKIVKEGICWPIDLVKNSSGQFVGYIMSMAKGKPMQHTMFVKPVLERSFPNWSRIDLVNLCIAFLDKISFLHSINIIIGDINPLNVLITEESNNVWLVDTDSFQIEEFPCPVGTVNFTAPEIQGKNYAEFMRTREHELFAIATMLFMILHPGKPPYAQQGGGDPAENIKRQNFSYPFGKDVSGKAPEGPWQNIWANLPGKVKEAFWNTFKKNQRIEVSDWKKLIKLYRSEILKGWHSNELFPTTFKIIDPIEVVCGNCSETVVASEKRYRRIISEGKPYYCGKCMANMRLQILARKARIANQSVRTDRSNSSNQTFRKQTSRNPPRGNYHQAHSGNQGSIVGIIDAIFNLFK